VSLLRPLAIVTCTLVSGCIGGGEGWVTGSMWIASCANGNPLDRKGDFDLSVNFFTGESVEDDTSSTLRRNALTLRLQNASLNIEDSDGLLLQLWDLAGIAQTVVRGDPVGVTSKDVCSVPCPIVDDQLRSTLYLHNSCPDGRQPLLATSHEMSPAGSADCLKPTGKELPACPTLLPADRQTLTELCLGRFDDRTRGDAIEAVLGGGACIYFCQLGAAKPGGALADPRSFRINYGDRVSALLAFNIVDGRSVTTSTCAAATGKVRGMFSYDVIRGRSAQAFP
jgi:hypothetical protein